jgi:hypothetical protein
MEHNCYCGKNLDSRGFCSKKCHDEYYDDLIKGYEERATAYFNEKKEENTMSEFKDVEEMIPNNATPIYSDISYYPAEIEEQWDDIIDYYYPSIEPGLGYDYEYLDSSDPIIEEVLEEDDTPFLDYEYPFSERQSQVEFEEKLTVLFEELFAHENLLWDELQIGKKYVKDDVEISLRRARWASFSEAVERIRIFIQENDFGDEDKEEDEGEDNGFPYDNPW